MLLNTDSANESITDFFDTLLASIQTYFKAFVDAWNTFFTDGFFTTSDET